MKKTIRSILALVLAFNMTAAPAIVDFGTASVPAFAAGEDTETVKEFSADSFVFRINDDGTTCSLISFDEPVLDEDEDSVKVDIPGSVSFDGKEYTVTAVENRAFSGKDLSSVTIPNTVEFIGYEAFSNNQELTEIIIPDSVTEIGLGAFAGTGLKSVTIPGSIKDLGCCFNHCYYLEDVVVEDGVETIAMGCFFADDKLKSFEFTDSLVFADPFNMQNHNIKGTERLKKISDPFVYDESSGTIYRKYDDHAEVLTTFDLKKIKPEIDGLSVTAIAANAMFESVYNPEFPDFITKIGKYAFSYAGSSNEIVYIPDTVKEIERDAFCASYFGGVCLPESVTNPEEIFTYCSNLDPSNIVYDERDIIVPDTEITKLTDLTDNRVYFKDGYNGNLWLTDAEGSLEYFGNGTFESIWKTNTEYFGYCGKEFNTAPDSVLMDYEFEADDEDKGKTYAGVFCHGSGLDEYFLLDYYTPEAYDILSLGKLKGTITVNGEKYDVHCFETITNTKYIYCIRKAGPVKKNSVDAVSFIKALGSIEPDAKSVKDANVFVINDSGEGKLNVIKNDIQEVYFEMVEETTQTEVTMPEETTGETKKETQPVVTEVPDVTGQPEEISEKDEKITSGIADDNNENGNTERSDSQSNGTYASMDGDAARVPATSEAEIIYGDINGDGVADLTDLTYLSLYLMDSASFNTTQMKAADVDGNGLVDIADLPYFKQYVCKDARVTKLGPKN